MDAVVLWYSIWHSLVVVQCQRERERKILSGDHEQTTTQISYYSSCYFLENYSFFSVRQYIYFLIC